jgi:hypothetical protein
MMKRFGDKGRMIGGLCGVCLLSAYVICYFITTEVFRGQLGDDKMDFRLFSSRWHYGVFTPAIRFEEWFRTREQAKPTFYGHIRNGASLPPGRDPEE